MSGTGSNEISDFDLLGGGSINRAAFPAYKVFIFYKDVTADVIEVHSDHSGGSVERTAGGLSLTLVNPNNRYIITHREAAIIGQSKAALNNSQDNSYAWKFGSSVTKLIWEELEDLIIHGEKEGSLAAILDYTKMYGIQIADDLDKFIAVGDNGDIAIDREFLKAKVLDDGELYVQDQIDQGNLNVLFDNTLKREILAEKMKGYVTIGEEIETTLSNYLNRIGSKKEFRYPLFEGGCIFNVNDPIRVAFRDPFDPRIWYWEFTGFIDTWTESQGENKDSVINITCTDVTKMARYSTVEESVGLLDQADEGSNAAGSGSFGVQISNEKFADLSVFEILEVLFFGTEHIDKGVDAILLSQIRNMDSSQIRDYLITNLKINTKQIDSYFTKDTEDFYGHYNTEYVRAKQSAKDLVYEGLRNNFSDRYNQFKDFGIIANPLGIGFKRSGKHNMGVQAYFFGEPTEEDLFVGKKITSLKEWNDTIHQRVTKSDIINMAAVYEDEIDALLAKNLDVADIIDTIGTNGDIYPVGAGRVFYFTLANIGDKLGRGVLDQSPGFVANFHSNYRDKLSYLYDIAERIEFCFYSTPRGDIVMEMPFYDYDVTHFENPQDLLENSFDSLEAQKEYENIYQQTYEGGYTPEELEKLTELKFNILNQGINYEAFDYNNIPYYDYKKVFTIEEHEQHGWGHTNSDKNVCTQIRTTYNFDLGSTVDPINQSLKDQTQFVTVKLDELWPTLGKRTLDMGPLRGYIIGIPEAASYAGIMLRVMNAEAHTLSVSTIPKFGLMANRPVFWRTRNYGANIVSFRNSIVWNSSCETTLTLNHVRAWTGEVDEQGNMKLAHFGGDQPWDWSRLGK